MSDQEWQEVEQQWLEVQKTVDAVIANLGRLAERNTEGFPDGATPLNSFSDKLLILVGAVRDAVTARSLEAGRRARARGRGRPTTVR